VRAPRRRTRDRQHSDTNISVVVELDYRSPNGDDGIYQHVRHFRDDIHSNQTPLGAAAVADLGSWSIE
jgi:hypothetical protein